MTSISLPFVAFMIFDANSVVLEENMRSGNIPNSLTRILVSRRFQQDINLNKSAKSRDLRCLPTPYLCSHIQANLNAGDTDISSSGMNQDRLEKKVMASH